MQDANFAGLRVLALESRRAKEIATLIRNWGGVPTVVSVMREVPLESNEEALSFARDLIAGQFDLVIFLTGVGARLLLNAVETRFPREDFLNALKRTTVAVRGPKPVAALRELGISADIVSEEPSTWRELLTALDAKFHKRLRGLRTAVQEYGAVNELLLDGLKERGALVRRVPVYQWALPDNLDDIRSVIGALQNNEFDVVLFLTSIQVTHLVQMAEQMGERDALIEKLKRLVILSVGPSTTEELARHGIAPDFVPSHPKMGILVSEAAKAVPGMIEAKRAK